MHLERLEFDRTTRELGDERVGDDGIFSGARVDWSGCMKSDRAWIFEQLDLVLARWTATAPDALAGSRWRLVGTAEGDSARYALASAGADGAWVSCAPWEALAEVERAAILEAIDEILATVNALLLIYD